MFYIEGEAARHRSQEWRESVERTDMLHSPSGACACCAEFSFREMRYMLGFIQRCNQAKSVQQPFNKWPGTSIVWSGKKKLTPWVCDLVKKRQNLCRLTLVKMFNYFDTVDSVEFSVVAQEVFELTMAKLKIGRGIGASCIADR